MEISIGSGRHPHILRARLMHFPPFLSPTLLVFSNSPRRLPQTGRTVYTLQAKKDKSFHSKAKRILVNAHGQRLDEPIKTLDKDLAYKLKQLKLCNRNYLSKDCSYGNSCTHSHKRPLAPVELDNLRHVARSTACEYGLDCMNPDCCNGHRCQYARRCTNWMNGTCWFSDDMHTVDVPDTKTVIVEA